MHIKIHRLTLGALLVWQGLFNSASALEQAPELAAQVAAGSLPVLTQRLPAKPEVIKPLAQAGRYGGTLHTALLSQGDENGMLRFMAQGLTRWDTKFEQIVPNIVEHWSRNDAATEYLFNLRAGMRWSDGKPFTADDIVFAVNDVLGNRQIFAAVADRYQAGGQVMRAEKVDETTVRVRFAVGNRMLAEELAGPYGHHPVLYPKHYCGQFHPAVNAQAEVVAKDSGYANWADRFRAQCGDYATRWSNPAKPTLDPWVIVEPYQPKAARVVAKRNPYFWQVDDKGLQLPYIDTIEYAVLATPAAVLEATASGKFDLQIRHVSGVAARQKLEPTMASGEYAQVRMPDVNASAVGLYLNHTSPRLPLRVLLASVRFKTALSLGIDRSEIASKVFADEVKPWQVGPPAGHRFYNEKLASQFINHDLAAANRILDELGLTRRDAEGYRLILGGGRLSLRAIVNNNANSAIDSLKLIRQSWAKLGVDLLIEAADRSVVADRARSNDYDVGVDVVSGGLDPTQNPRAYLTVHPADSRQSLPWVQWYDSQGKLGEEPSPAMQRRLVLWDSWKAARSDAEADRLFKEILAIAADELEVLGTVSSPAQTGIRRKRLHNVPDIMPGAWIWPTPNPSLPQQYFLSQ